MTHPPANPLVTALANGQADAYAALYDRLASRLFRFAKTMIRDSAEAEDAVHDVFVQLVRHRDRLAVVHDLDAYVFTALRYAVGHRIKRRDKEHRLLREWRSPAAQTPAAEHGDDELERALKSLPAKQRELIALKIDGDLTFAQIGDVLQVSPNTAASRYRYALEKLRNYLELEQ